MATTCLVWFLLLLFASAECPGCSDSIWPPEVQNGSTNLIDTLCFAREKEGRKEGMLIGKMLIIMQLLEDEESIFSTRMIFAA